MRRFTLWILVLFAATAAIVNAQDRSRSYTDRVTGGSLVVTQDVEDMALELKHVMFTLPTSITNVFQIQHVRTYKLPDIQTSNVETTDIVSPITGSYEIRTNTYWYSQGAVTFTNTYVVATTELDTATQVYDTDDFPKDWTFEHDDLATFSFTETNAFNLIRVYDLYVRP